MIFDEAISRWVLLGDSLALTIPAKAMTEILLLRLRYGKAVGEFENMRDDAWNSAATAESRTETLKELLGKDSSVDAVPLSEETFAEIVAAAMTQQTIRSRLSLDEKGEPMEIPCGVWLERFSVLTIVPQ